MTENHELSVWKPSEFKEGTDLLPIDLGCAIVDTTGRDNIEAADLILPTIKLLQGMSPEVASEDDPECKPGRMYHTGVSEAFDAPMRVLLCAHTRSRALFPKEKEADYAGLEKCVSRNGVQGDRYGDCAICPHKEWRSGNRPPLCSESHNFTAITPMGPAIIRFARTSFQAARNFLTTWTLSPKPLWAHPTLIVVKKEPKMVDGKHTFFHRMELKWLMRETVPATVAAAAKAVHEQVSAAHEAGRLGATDENDGAPAFDDIPL